MVCGQSVQKDLFFFDTNLLDVDSMRSARDAMDVDSNDEHQGISIFPFYKQSGSKDASCSLSGR